MQVFNFFSPWSQIYRSSSNICRHGAEIVYLNEREAVGTHSTWCGQRVRRGEVLVGRRCRRLLSESEWCWLQSGRSTRGRGCARGITPSPRGRRKLSAPLICQINNSAAADPPTGTRSYRAGPDQKAMRVPIFATPANTKGFCVRILDFGSSLIASWMWWLCSHYLSIIRHRTSVVGLKLIMRHLKRNYFWFPKENQCHVLVEVHLSCALKGYKSRIHSLLCCYSLSVDLV
jgi:hypothetical protein